MPHYNVNTIHKESLPRELSIGYNFELVESGLLRSWLSKYAKMKRKMNRGHFVFFIIYVQHLLNLREEEKLRNSGYMAWSNNDQIWTRTDNWRKLGWRSDFLTLSFFQWLALKQWLYLLFKIKIVLKEKCKKPKEI